MIVALISLLSTLVGWNIPVLVASFVVFAALALAARSFALKTSPTVLAVQQLKAYTAPVSRSGRSRLA